MRKGIANDKLINLLIVGTIIIVVILILYSMFPKISKPFADEIDKIRKEVFGIDIGMEEGEEEKAINSFNELVNAFKETSKGKIGCVSGLKSISKFSSKYSIEVQSLGDKTKLSLFDESNVMPKGEDIDNPVVIDDVKPCVMKDSAEGIKDFSSFVLKYGKVPYIDNPGNPFDYPFYSDSPVLYKLDEDNVCFVIKKVGDGGKEYFKGLPVCGEENGLSGKVIVIDAGHGGKDEGAKGVKGTLEKNINLIIANDLKKSLDGAGAEVIMTREIDKYISLSERAEIVKVNNADMFVSIHANSHRFKDWWVVGSTVSSFYHGTRASAYCECPNYIKGNGEVEECLVDECGISEYKFLLSRKLALKIQNHLTNKLNLKDRGAGAGDFDVLGLVEGDKPAVVVETAYLSNPKEEDFLNKYHKNVARAIYSGISDYYKKGSGATGEW